jgi:hypothetical protein
VVHLPSLSAALPPGTAAEIGSFLPLAIGLHEGPSMATQDKSGITACYDVIATLEQQLRTANQLREQLESGAETPEFSQRIDELSQALLTGAVEAARATATLRDETRRGADVSRSRRPWREPSDLRTEQ